MPNYGEHYSISRTGMNAPANDEELLEEINRRMTDPDDKKIADLQNWVKTSLPGWDFNTYRWVLKKISELENWSQEPTEKNLNGIPNPVSSIIHTLTYFIDYLRTMDTGNKAKSSLLDITRKILYEFFDQCHTNHSDKHKMITSQNRKLEILKNPSAQTLVIDATGFQPEGFDPQYTLAAQLARAYENGWRKFILYRVNGQRLISTAVMGTTDTDDVEMDVYGTPGEYFGAFMQGGIIRLHGKAQNFTAMCMHHGELQIFGNAGKVCGYASKGGKVFILGDIVDRAWTNSVNDPRCQDLQIHILGRASKYCGEFLMGGDFFFGGLSFDHKGQLKIQDRPYRGTKLLGGASRGNMLFFDPNNRLDPSQYVHGKLEEIACENWPKLKKMVIDTLKLSGVDLKTKNGEISFTANGKLFEIKPDNFKLLVPKGGLKGYESH